MNHAKPVVILLFVLILTLSLSACFPEDATPNSNESANLDFEQYIQDISLAESHFFLQIPEPISDELVIEIIDDVTGIELNPTRYALQKIDDTHYGIIVPLKIGAIVKYRYYRSAGLPIYETDKNNKVIDYRAVYIDEAKDFSDILTNWADRQYNHVFGRLEGQVLNRLSGSPLPDLLVIVAGNHVMTDSSGVFKVENLPPGKHNLIVLSTDGEYSVFQQEAMIAESLTTPAMVAVDPIDFVNITFLVKPPENIIDQPIRIMGNTYQLGNVFGTVYNGESAVAARSPVLGVLPDGSYSITISLPVGFNLIYKYSMGNGFWNAELDPQNNFFLRNIIIPQEDTLITDVVHTFQSTNSSPINFNVKIPGNLPVNDGVSIQFSGFGWSSPIPMTQRPDGTFTYSLYGPFNMIDDVQYRLCRNDACSAGNETSLSTVTKPEWTVKKSESSQDVNMVVDQWPAWSASTSATEIITPAINMRESDFLAGFEINPIYNVFTPVYATAGFQNMSEVSANSVVIPVQWTLQSFEPVILGPQVGLSPLWKDLVSMIAKAQSSGMDVLLVPSVTINANALAYLNENSLSEPWDRQFSGEYQRLLEYVADLAAFTNVRAVILRPALSIPEGFQNADQLSYLSQQNIPSDFQIIKGRYDGAVLQQINLEDTNYEPSTFNMFDQIIVEISLDLGEDITDQAAFTTSFIDMINSRLDEIHNQAQKPLIVRLSYPSAFGANRGCIRIEDQCISFSFFNQPEYNSHNLAPIDLNLQSQIYQAALTAINETSWINGILSDGFNLQLALQDASGSVRGKPAMDVLWYWYPRLLGKIN